MADQNTKDIDILERVSELPDDLRKAIFAPSTTEAIQEVGRGHNLMIDKIGELAQETGRVMLGITPPSEYVKNLASRLGVAPEKARAIAEEINQKVFQPVRESLKKVHGVGAPTPPQKPLPTRQDIKLAQQPPPPSQAPTPEIPSIFVKNIPPPIGETKPAAPDIVPPKSEQLPKDPLAAKSALEKELNAPPTMQRPRYEKDPYREPLV